MVRLNIVQ